MAHRRELAEVGAQRLFPGISIQHGVKKPKFEIEIEGDTKEFKDLEIVVVNHVTGRELYLIKDNPVPDCVSVGGTYGTNYGTCAQCKYNVFGSGPNGSKMCKETRRLASVVKGLPGVYELKVPPTSLSSFDKAKKSMVLYHPVNAGLIKVTLGIKEDTGKKAYSIIEMAYAGPWYKDTSDADFIKAINDGILMASSAYAYTEAPEGDEAGMPADNPMDNAPAGKAPETRKHIEEAQGDEVPF